MPVRRKSLPLLGLTTLLSCGCDGQYHEQSEAMQQMAVDPMGGAYSPSQSVFQASTWAPLDAAARAKLYVASAAVGLLGKELRQCAQLLEPTEFQYGEGMAVRGAAALTDLPPPTQADEALQQASIGKSPGRDGEASVICSIGEDSILSLATVQRMLMHSLAVEGDPRVLDELVSLGQLVSTPADERALLAVLFIRETGRASSPLMPYLQALLFQAHEHIPSAWNPASTDGAARRQALAASSANGPTVLRAADALRKTILQAYGSMLPKARSPATSDAHAHTHARTDCAPKAPLSSATR